VTKKKAKRKRPLDSRIEAMVRSRCRGEARLALRLVERIQASYDADYRSRVAAMEGVVQHAHEAVTQVSVAIDRLEYKLNKSNGLAELLRERPAESPTNGAAKVKP